MACSVCTDLFASMSHNPGSCVTIYRGTFKTKLELDLSICKVKGQPMAPVRSRRGDGGITPNQSEPRRWKGWVLFYIPIV